MILVDPRAGSRELIPTLQRRFRLPVDPLHLDSADVAWVGNGPKGSCSVGVEVKKIPDLLQSLEDHRFVGHQLRAMHDSYDYLYLLVVGTTGCDKNGYLMAPRSRPGGGGRGGRVEWRPAGGGNWMWKDFEAWLTTLAVRGGITILRADSNFTACRHLSILYHWWQKKWADHHGLDVFWSPPPDDRRLLARPHSLVRRWAKELSGVGWKRSGAVDARFTSAREMVDAGVKDWQSIEGIGAGIALSVVQQITHRRMDNAAKGDRPATRSSSDGNRRTRTRTVVRRPKTSQHR